jgi:predicted transcriptional regulator of viral defense system
MECLKAYQQPRVKLHHLLKIGALIRVKKGIYIFDKKFAKRPYCSEVLANMIYGPSYVSLEWACQYYRLIPEKVTTVTSVTTQRFKRFETPLGWYTYDHLHKDLYPVGVTLFKFSDRQQALMATKEKALVDLLCIRRGVFTSVKQLKETLFEDLRIDPEDLRTFNLNLLEEIYNAYSHLAIKFLVKLLKRMKSDE